MVPKGNVRAIGSAKRQGGRPRGLGYDPATGEEIRGATYRGEQHEGRGAAAEDDVLAVVGRGYRPDRFYTASVNDHDHGERMTIRVPKGLDSQIHAAVSKITWYRSPQAFFRDAAVHRLEWLQRNGYDLGDELRRFVELEQRQADRDRRAHEVALMSGTVKAIETSLQTQWDNEDWGMMGAEIDAAREEQEWAREPYKSQIGKLIDGWEKRAREHIAKYQAALED